ncbi:hypothetical protein SteCoe_17011 [Stentor coeruleus]|uniref:Uncharacterized protein n=1 Tax=Stentor coeruleus TaxID=5963 RepID=A0A1R2BZX5_9CILI|nr:hypothetical protein SteCoe_17011 [Stentor coeruleus]
MAQPIGRFDSSGVAAALRLNESRTTPPQKFYSQDFSSKLAELEEKLKEQERFNTFLVDQINRVEGKVTRVFSRGHGSTRGDDRIIRLEEEFKKLEMQVNREPKDLRVFQQDSEIMQIRNFMQEKITEDYKLHQQHKDKGQALLGEVNRLGENYEKTNEMVQSMSMSLENRILAIENRINTGERQVVTIDTKSEGGMNMLIELANKVEKRIQMLETALLSLGNEYDKSTKSIDRVETGAFRLQEDLKVFFKQLQSDIHGRLETKSSDLVNKLLQEQEERLRNHEDLKYNFELKDKMTQEKLSFDRNEFKSRLVSLESYLKAELQRKEEMIQNLNSSFENQIRNLYETIKMNEASRHEREEQMANEITHALDSNMQAIDQYKHLQGSITEKITEMVRTEIEVRQKGEKDFKVLIQTTMKGILQEISVQKDIIDRLKMKFEHDLQVAQSSFSEKADILSRYIEEESQRTSDLIKSQHGQTKEMITKITESLKSTIISTEKWKSEVIKRFGKVDSYFQMYKNDMNKNIESNDERNLQKLKELQDGIEGHMLSNMKIIENRVETLAGMVESSLNTFEGSLLANRQGFVEIANKLNVEISENYGVICKDLQNLANEINNVKEEIDSLNDNNNEKIQEIIKRIAATESGALVLVTSEKLIRENMINRISEDFDERFKEIEDKATGIDERLNEEEKIQQGNDDRNLEKFKEIAEKMKKISKIAKGSKTGFILEAEEKERNKVVKETQIVMENLLNRVEAKVKEEKILEFQENIQTSQQEIQKIKEILAKKIRKLKAANTKLSEESKLLIEDIFNQKVAKIQEIIKEDNEKLWNLAVNKVKAPKVALKDETEEMNQKISSVATTEKPLLKPKLRL